MICLLELHCDDNDIDISETALHQAIDELRMTWATMQIGQKHLHDKMPLTDTEVISILNPLLHRLFLDHDIIFYF